MIRERIRGVLDSEMKLSGKDECYFGNQRQKNEKTFQAMSKIKKDETKPGMLTFSIRVNVIAH